MTRDSDFDDRTIRYYANNAAMFFIDPSQHRIEAVTQDERRRYSNEPELSSRLISDAAARGFEIEIDDENKENLRWKVRIKRKADNKTYVTQQEFNTVEFYKFLENFLFQFPV
ncbi:hypothetical protein DFH11DRAFT_1541961 [Phellopilus nigrolimitatus]|nr:hypothetical protein DFH11DRAFT_1541961 [Phellopilus nigrolimitatus]